MTLLSLAGVTRTHPVGRELRPTLDDASLKVWPGDVVAIWGVRRSGKTTLLRVAAGVEMPDAGTVRVCGHDIARLSESERTRCLRQVGYAAKDWRVASGKPVLDHVALPLLADGRPLSTAMAKAHEAIAMVGATGCAEAFSHELLPGDMTRVALAQALVREPRLLLVDEPAVAADPDERDALLRLLQTLAAERDFALVLTSRDAAGVGAAARVMSIGDGRLRSYDREPAEVVAFPMRAGVEPEPVG